MPLVAACISLSMSDRNCIKQAIAKIFINLAVIVGCCFWFNFSCVVNEEIIHQVILAVVRNTPKLPEYIFVMWMYAQMQDDLFLYYINEINFGHWLTSGFLDVSWTFSFNSLNTIMLFIVYLISTIVHIYSKDYMWYDQKIYKFIAYLSLFTFFMSLLITGDNFLILFLGWEGVGLCSFLLISFWNTRILANKAAIKALLVNRVADIALTIALLLIFVLTGSLTFDIIFSLIFEYDIYGLNFIQHALTLNGVKNQTYTLLIEVNFLSIITSLLFIGAMGKSAQIGLHTWLPDAMEGPTPVSALIHAATMVTAGVFLIIKCSPLFEVVPVILLFIVFTGALTAFVSASIGLVQNDIKKVIAYSTCSQLGYMIFSCGLSVYNLGFFHLVNHAFFKALLFLSAGAIIHGMSNEQDLRRLGGIAFIMPFTAIMLLIGSLALMGFPFLTGFYSKDMILEVAYSTWTISALFSYLLGIIAAFFTAIYSYRIFYLTFILPNNANKCIIKTSHEIPASMVQVLLILAVLSIFGGYFLKDIFIGVGSSVFNDVIYISPLHNNQLENEYIPQIVKLLPLLIAMSAIVSINVLFLKHKVRWALGLLVLPQIYNLVIYKWYFDWIYNKFINYKVINLSFTLFKTIDKQFLEWFGPFGGSNSLFWCSNTLKKLQSGNMQHYAYIMICALILWSAEINITN